MEQESETSTDELAVKIDIEVNGHANENDTTPADERPEALNVTDAEEEKED